MKSDWAWVGYMRNVGKMTDVVAAGGVHVVSDKGSVGSSEGSNAAG